MSSPPTMRSSTANAFAGPYTITSYDFNNLISYKANPDYKGLLAAAKTETVNVKYYTDASNLKLDVQEGNIDVANRTLSATDIEDLRGNDNVKVVDGPGGEIRYLVFNFDTMPFGATTAEADPAKALAVRQAIADLIDRDAISEDVYKGTFTPLYSYVPEGLAGANEALKGLYGDGSGAPDPDKAAERLEAAGITTPVELNIQYVAERYGPSSSDEYAHHQGQPRVERPVHGEPAVDRVGPVLRGPRRRPVPGVPAGLVPRLLGRRQLPHAVLPHGELPREPLRQPRGERPDPRAGRHARTRQPARRSSARSRTRSRPTCPRSRTCRARRSRSSVRDVEGAEDTLDASFKFRYGALSKG